MAKTTIQWTMGDDGTPGETINPSVGCERRSPGCDQCYAFTLHDQRHVAWKRGRWPNAPVQYHLPFSTLQTFPERIEKMRRLARVKKPKRFFVDSMSDLFCGDELDRKVSIPIEFIDQVWDAMSECPQHTFQILTKRAKRMRDVVNEVLVPHYGILPNVHLGNSVENQEAADERIPYLLQTQAAIRFLSMEPLLSMVDIEPWLELEPVEPEEPWEPISYERTAESGLHWIIIGGESGPHARNMRLEWVRYLLSQCRAADVPIFVKQLGTTWAKQNKSHDRHGADMNDWPEDLCIREFPQIAK